MMTKSSWLLRYIVRTTERCIVSVKCRCQGSCVQPMGLLYHPLSLLLNCSNAGGCEQPIPLRMHFTYLSHTRLNIRVSQNMVTPSPVLVSTQGGKINLHQTGHCSFQQQRVSVCVWEDGESEISSGDDDLGTLSRPCTWHLPLRGSRPSTTATSSFSMNSRFASLQSDA
uniref:Uncharacterized protein n=1 Tax=Physcomitrium patens TaxID=3218 RepID=A0A2K1J8N3_PHYPA|nr:hypothetical protein PHYPA_020994 [Physcomitrium patens]